MNLAIRDLTENGTVGPEQVDRFMSEHTFPIVEGRMVTFVFRGAADAVNLQHWIYGLEASQPFERVQESDLWYLVLELPERSRLEYKIDVQRDGDRQWIRDPLNPHLARDPYGANSVCHGQGYEVPEWTRPDAEARPGTIDSITLPHTAFGESRDVRLYLPARLRRDRQYPILVVHDGGDYVKYASLQTILDNLIYRLEITPLIVALTSSDHRLVEYANDDRHATFIADELVPLLQSRLPVADDPSRLGMMGASFGAVACLSTAWRRQGLFGRLLLQSGSFAFSDIGTHGRKPVFDPVAEFTNAFREQPGRPADRLFVSCGTYESLIYENRSLIPLLQSSDMDVRYVEARDGHNWENWRDRLREGLSWLFPGPLWYMYE